MLLVEVERKFDLAISLEVAEHLDEEKANIFVDNLKRRSPELFSDRSDALPMTIHFNHTTTSTTNSGLALLSVFTLFIFPGILSHEHNFDVKIKIGEREQYVKDYSFKIRERTYLSIIPFFAFLLPPQSGYFCHSFVAITDEAVETQQLQNAFLNMIYRLDKDKLRRFSDDKKGTVELLDMD